MDTRKLRTLGDDHNRDGRDVQSALYAAANYIETLRAHCQRQRKELKRLNASNQRIQDSRNKRRHETFLQILRGDLERALEFTKTLRPSNILARVEELEKSTERVARFVGAVPAGRVDAYTESAIEAALGGRP